MDKALFFSVVLLVGGNACAQLEFADDFESGLERWAALSVDHVEIVKEPDTGNHVLQLTPRTRDLSHALIKPETPQGHVRMEGRFLFPTEGDGYLGFIYNHQADEERTDSGVIYVKSNGSYVRISPHYDGNPSWRLYEELKVDLEGDRHISPYTWYDFRLDVHGRVAALYIGDLSSPVVVFNEAPTNSGTLGLEARPGRGEPVWVDDIRVSALPATANPETSLQPRSRLARWQYQAAIEDPLDAALEPPELADTGWRDLAPDSRGAIVTGLLTQSSSGERNVVYLRASFDETGEHETGWLAVSSANRIDVWMDGFFRGTVAPERFIWSDHVRAPNHNGARLPLLLKPGHHELLFRVYGDRFAGGGFFAGLVYPGED
jgi:hypothetical protein